MFFLIVQSDFVRLKTEGKCFECFVKNDFKCFLVFQLNFLFFCRILLFVQSRFFLNFCVSSKTEKKQKSLVRTFDLTEGGSKVKQFNAEKFFLGS